MRLRFVPDVAVGLSALLLAACTADACTSLIVTRGASADGSVIVTYTCDGEFHPHLQYIPAGDHGPDEWIGYKDRDGKLRGRVRQVPHTYAVVGLMNEHQLAIGETTFGGRDELHNPDGLLNYWHLMRLALQRARTAREAIQVMTDLVDEYGYASTGESISIADTKEAWLLEMIGPGPGKKGAIWVAVRIPDGNIAATANKARIGQFPLEDPDNCLYSENVISFAIEKGYFDPSSNAPFSFCDAYCPPTPENLRWAETRVWSLFRRAAPSLNLPADYHRGAEGAERYPLWVKPDRKLSVADVFGLMRDHYEGTPFDMTQGIDAGPYGSPLRSRPLQWEAEGHKYAWERPISTQQTGYSFVSQSRGHLPDPVGGVFWYAVDDTYTNCYVPLYCGIDSIPKSFAVGGLDAFSWDSAWWVFNFVSNYANLRYVDMVQDIQAVQRDLEGTFLAVQPAVERTAVDLLKSNPDLARRYLTDYSVSHGEMVVQRWRELGEHLVTKYNDGFVQSEPGRPGEPGYRDEWLQRVLRDKPQQFRLPAPNPQAPQARLED